MSSFSIKLNKNRPWRYAFKINLWHERDKKFSNPIQAILDTGAFNTFIHREIAGKYSTIFKETRAVAIGGYKTEANLCLIDKMDIGGMVIANVLALAVDFKGELKDHILLGANIINNWDVGLSRKRNELRAVEDFPDDIPNPERPYQFYFDSKGRAVALQEMEAEKERIFFGEATP